MSQNSCGGSSGITNGAPARTEHVLYLALELPVDAGLLDLAHQRSQAGPDGHAEEGYEEQQAEQQAPEHAPAGPAGYRVVVGVGVEPALRVTAHGRDRVRLDDEIVGEPSVVAGRPPPPAHLRVRVGRLTRLE